MNNGSEDKLQKLRRLEGESVKYNRENDSRRPFTPDALRREREIRVLRHETFIPDNPSVPEWRE
jgi:hypothetical protein